MSIAMGSADSGYDPDAFNVPVSDYDLMREVIFAHQGLNGKIIRQDHTNGGRFVITQAYTKRISSTQRTMMERLTNLGWLLHKIKSYISYVSKDPSHGRVAQNLAAALNAELFEYYSVVTQIEQQLQKMDTPDAYVGGAGMGLGSTMDLYPGHLSAHANAMQMQLPIKSQLGCNMISTRTRASTPTSDQYCPSLAPANNAKHPSSIIQGGSHYIGQNGFGGQPNGGGYNSLHTRGPTHSATFDCLRSCSNGYLNRDTDAKSSSDDGLQSLVVTHQAHQNCMVSLHMIYSWSFDFYSRFKILAMLVECARGQRGGHLAMIVHKFLQQGDKSIKSMITRILSQVVLPIRTMLCQWIFHGEIIDPHREFFIFIEHEDDTTFKINPVMMPGFITKLQAMKILVTGKAILLLRRVCKESISSSVPGYDDLKKSFESTSIESLFAAPNASNPDAVLVPNGTNGRDDNGKFQQLLELAYKQVSQKSLKLLFDNYNLMSHFRALRRYLLLGQGDFIRHLMDLLERELDKPANEVRFQNIIQGLESAIRSTNAKYDSADITNRLDCKLPDTSKPNACGWDTFILIYEVDGPISMIFTPDRIADYVKLFRQLWRAKRIEHILTSLWSSQMFYSKTTKKLPQISSIFHKANILLSEMLHFMQRFQEFVMFEVIECSWFELEQKIKNARDIDELIAAHDAFLRKAKHGALCASSSYQESIEQNSNSIETLNKQLTDLFNCSIAFRDLMTNLSRNVDYLTHARKRDTTSMSSLPDLGRTFDIELNRDNFLQQLTSLSGRYHTGVQRFLNLHNIFTSRNTTRAR